MKRASVPLGKWKTSLPLLAIATNWALILGSMAVAKATGSLILVGFAVVIIGARQHALFVMIHEAAHRHLSHHKILNDWVSDLFCAFPLFFDTDVYRKNHLAHHRHLNTEHDPDWVRKVGRPEWTFPVDAGPMLAFIPAFVLWRGPREWATILWRFSGFGDRNRWRAETRFLSIKLIYFSSMLAVTLSFGVLPDFIVFWLVPMFFVLPGVGRVRSIAEHFALSYADANHSTRDVRAGWIESFFLAPHNVGYHLTHHQYPHLTFYDLPKAHRELCANGELANAHINGSYIFPFHQSVLKDVLEGVHAASEESSIRAKRVG